MVINIRLKIKSKVNTSKKNKKNMKNIKTKRYKNKSKRDRRKLKKTKKYRGGNGKEISFIFIDKHNYGEIEFLKESNDETIIDVINTFKHDLQLQHIDVKSSVNLLCLLDENNNIIGFVLGTVNANQKYIHHCHISNVYINKNHRGKSYCNLMMDYYIKKIMELYYTPTVRLTFTLDNTGGERSCKCYTNSFIKNGFLIMSSNTNCKNHENNDVMMEFQSPPRYQTRSVTNREKMY